VATKTQPEGPVAEALANVEVDTGEETLETRNGFSLFRKGKGYSVKNPAGVAIAPLTSREEAEQLFRNMSRKF
jgi:hypothetical protein